MNQNVLMVTIKASMAEATREVERQLLNEHVYGCALRGLPSCDFLLRRLWGLRLVDWLLLVWRLLMLVRLRLLGVYTEEHMGSLSLSLSLSLEFYIFYLAFIRLATKF